MGNIDDRPLGAVENGDVFMDRIERDYEFSCEAGSLNLCSDWIELRRCFEVMADYIRHKSTDRVEAAGAELAQYEAQEPVATVELRVLNGRRVKHIYPINLENVEAGSTLYASPAPAADLKEENDKLKSQVNNLIDEINDLQETITRLENKYT